jgi:hypothetical protein
MAEASLLRPSQDELDPELLELPDPPKRERTVTVALLLVTALASALMVLALRRDAAYAFGAPRAQELGDLTTVAPAALSENAYVRAHGMLGAAHAIRYERPLTSGSYRLMPVPGRTDLWVEVRVPPRGENQRWVPPPDFAGRLVRFDRAGPRHRGLAAAVQDAKGEAIPEGAWLLVDGAAPSDARWAVLLVIMFLGFAVWNTVATARLLRKAEG